MRVRVKVFASLQRFVSESLPGTPFELELPPGATVADLVRQVGLPEEQVKVVFVNGLIQPFEHPLAPGDDVGIFPPIAGG